MKLRHAAALSLLIVAGCASAGQGGSFGGWLLMVPPLTSGGSADTGEPLSKWQIVGNFASQIDCNNVMTNEQFGAQAQLGPIKIAQTPSQGDAVKILNGQCVSTADPRLKGN
jgi:hypothetical protein